MHLAPRDRMNHERLYARLAAAVLFAQASFELIHLAMPWELFTPTSSRVMTVLLAAILIVAAVGIALHRGWGAGFGVAGVLAGLSLGVVVTAVGARLGLVHVTLAIVILFLLKRAMPWFGWTLWEAPMRPVPVRR
jgi:hypothetical protein